MKKTINDYEHGVKEKLFDGPGFIKQDLFATKEEMFNHVRLFSKMTLEPNCGIGVHEHTNETEIYYVISGKAQYYDDDKTYIIEKKLYIRKQFF